MIYWLYLGFVCTWPGLLSELNEWGLHCPRIGRGLLRDSHPDFVFVQEVTLPLHSLTAVVSGLGYTVWLSEAAQLGRCTAVLARRLAVVFDFIPG
jgi:hypothetical protein